MPGVQVVVDAPPVEYEPTGQFTPATTPSRQYWPAGHTFCVVIVEAWLQKKPAVHLVVQGPPPPAAVEPWHMQTALDEHAMHAVLPVLLLYVPGGQGIV